MIHRYRTITASALTLCAWIFSAHAGSLLINFGSTSVPTSQQMDSPHHTADPSFTDTTWNEVQVTDALAGSLLYADGCSASGVSVDLGSSTSGSTVNFTAQPASSNTLGDRGGIYSLKTLRSTIWNGGVDADDRWVGIRVDGLPVGTYSVYGWGNNGYATLGDTPMNFYAASAASASSFNFSTVTPVSIDNDSSSNWSHGNNYGKHVVTISANQSLFIAMDGSKAWRDRGFLSGIQIIEDGSTPPPAPNELILFDDSPQNGTSLWADGGSTSSLSTYPVESGSQSIELSVGAWSQAGLGLYQTPPAGMTHLEAKVYRTAGSTGSFIIRYGSSWSQLTLTTSNNSGWTLDGQPGHYAFSDNSWHTLDIDLTAMGIGSSVLKTVGVKGGSSTADFHLDEMRFHDGSGSSSLPPVPGSWTLIFEDDFNGSSLDSQKWRLGEHWLGMNGQSGISPDNIEVSGGNLHITAEKRPLVFGGTMHDYAAGEISTFKKFRQLYGYFEARIKYDAVRGLWPAFWLMPDRGNYGYANYNLESFLKFDLSSAPTTITSATLRIKAYSAVADSSVTIHPVLSNAWSENSVTWNTRPTYEAEWFAQVSDLAAGELVYTDVTDFIQTRKSSGVDASVALVDTFRRQREINFYSREAGYSYNRPTLVINGTTTIEAVEDAYVRGGTVANNNYGTEGYLKVEEPYESTASTYSGGMEIDIMESLGIWGDDITAHALHWDGYGSSHQSTGSGELTLSPTTDGYHTYGLYWAPGLIEMYVDGVQTWSYASSRVSSVTSYILLSLQLGGWGGNETISDSLLPAGMWVDYVRVWTE